MGWLNNPGIVNGLAGGISSGVENYQGMQQQKVKNQQAAIELAVKQRLADLQAQQIGSQVDKNQADLFESGLQKNPEGGFGYNPEFIQNGPDGKPLSGPESMSLLKAKSSGTYQKDLNEREFRDRVLKLLNPGEPQQAQEQPVQIPLKNAIAARSAQSQQAPQQGLSYESLSPVQKGVMGLDPMTDKMLGNLRGDAEYNLQKQKNEQEQQKVGFQQGMENSRFGASRGDVATKRKQEILDFASKNYEAQAKDHEKVAEVADKIMALAKQNTPGAFGSIKQMAVGLTKERPSVIAAKNIYDGVSLMDSWGNSANQMLGGGMTPEMQQKVTQLAQQAKDESLANIDAAKSATFQKAKSRNSILGAGLTDQQILDQMQSRTATKSHAPPDQSGPKVGDVVKGYKFKGGNPGDKGNWEKAK